MNGSKTTGFNATALTLNNTNTPAQVLGPNPKRKALILGSLSVSTGRVSWGFNENITAAVGMVNGCGSTPIVLTEDMIGSVIHDAVWACSSTLISVSATEIMGLD